MIERAHAAFVASPLFKGLDFTRDPETGEYDQWNTQSYWLGFWSGWQAKAKEVA